MRGKDGETADYPVATPGMIRRIPKRRALILRGDCAPVITHLPMVWNDWRYRLAKLQGRATADLTVPQATVRHAPVKAPAVSVAIPETAPAELASVGANGNGHAPGNGHSKPAAPYPWDKR